MATRTPRPRTGPRNDVDARGLILDAARSSFSENGYDATSLRAVARAAGVDVALVSYYFGSKRDLFVAAMELPVRPAEAIGRAFAEGRDKAGPRLVGTFLELWADPVTGPPFLAMFRSAMTQEDARRTLQEFASSEILQVYVEHLDLADVEEARLRAALAATQLVGIVMLRHVLRLEPHASMDPQRIVELIGPTVQHYLTGELPA